MMTGIHDARRCRWTALAALALALAFFSGCSVTPRNEPPSFGDWRAESGEPVDRIRFSNLIDWQALDRDWLALRFNGGNWFAVRPRDPCMADVREAATLELVSAMSNLLHRSDRVRLDDNVCRIEEIRAISSFPDETGVSGGGYLSSGG